ncbi:hypothetical protein [Mycobacterium tuberculosis]|uniref:hypothetical protein n=1 Tax=Mycobacterium tuberculosis TaxID=1773 RepID=UPI002729B9C2|nr:hypothetical protein [Mycobacterium tuberculosis]
MPSSSPGSGCSTRPPPETPAEPTPPFEALWPRVSQRAPRGAALERGFDTVAALGLAPLTLQRLRRLELDDCAALMRVAPEDLWRRLGRTALVDVVQRLKHHGLPAPALNAQQLSRLGLLDAAPPLQVMDDLRSAEVDFLTIGQYLQPTRKHHAVMRYVPPDEFASYEKVAYTKGFLMVSAAR